MATRYSGDLKISVTYLDSGAYRTSVSHKGRILWVGKISPPAVGFGRGVAYDSAEAYDQTAHAAISFADHAKNVGEYAETDEAGWKIRRVPRYWQQYPAGQHKPKKFARRSR